MRAESYLDNITQSIVELLVAYLFVLNFFAYFVKSKSLTNGIIAFVTL